MHDFLGNAFCTIWNFYSHDIHNSFWIFLCNVGFQQNVVITYTISLAYVLSICKIWTKYCYIIHLRIFWKCFHMFTFYTFSFYIRFLILFRISSFTNSNLLANVPWPQRRVQDALQLTLIPPFTCSAFDASRHFCSTWVAHWYWNLFSHFSHSYVFFEVM